MMQYPCVVRPLDKEDGGGFIAFFPDLPGCLSDGESPQEAIENAQDALNVYLEAQQQRGAAINPPDSASAQGELYISDLLAQIDQLEAKLSEAESALRAADARKLHHFVQMDARLNVTRSASRLMQSTG